MSDTKDEVAAAETEQLSEQLSEELNNNEEITDKIETASEEENFVDTPNKEQESLHEAVSQQENESAQELEENSDQENGFSKDASEDDNEGNDSVVHKPYDNSQTSLSTHSEQALEEVDEEGDESIEQTHSKQSVEYLAEEETEVPASTEHAQEATIYRFEEDATPEEISKSKNIKSTLSFLKKSFEDFMESKEFKNLSNASKYTSTSLTNAIEEINKILNSPENSIAILNSLVIFEALRSCCRCKINNGKVMALDGLSKLFAFQLLDESVLVNPPDSLSVNEDLSKDASGITPPPKLKLMDAAIDTITDCFEGEVTNENVELQIIRCLTSLILMEDSLNICHGQSLLKAIRTIYNIFIFSLNSSTQTIAQATLIQVVEKVFQRVRDFSDVDNNKLYSSTSLHNESVLSLNSQIIEREIETPLNLDDMKKLNDEEEENIDMNSVKEEAITEEQLCIKDAFLVFRSMAKISVKSIEDTLDMRSHAVRSKLLSLHMLHSILRDQVSLFNNPNVKLYSNGDKSLIDSIRQYLCLSISRNATSPIAPVFEITLEILWLLVSNLRFYFKREIPIFFAEIYLPIAELKSSTNHQKKYFLQFLSKLSSDPKIIIEFYLNYDCDEKNPNLTEIIVDFLSNNTLNKAEQVTDLDKKQYIDSLKSTISTYDLSQLPLLSISNLAGGAVSNASGLSDSASTLQMFSSSASSTSKSLSNPHFPILYNVKLDSLRCIVLILRSLSAWADINTTITSANTLEKKMSRKASISSASNNNLTDDSETPSSVDLDFAKSTSALKISEEENEVQQFEVSKLRKTKLSNLVLKFNKKPKKVIPELLSQGFIENNSPASIAKFLLTTEGLNLSTVGDYLGEGNEENIAIMHSFVDQLDFKGLYFTDALRNFLQKFRLPGEGQKIDRFMLKFAERFVEQNPDVFAKADTAYVLAYAVIMLNTDLHSPQIKKRMTLEEFIDLTAGVNEPKDLTKEYVVGLYNEIQNNEIKLLSEQHEAALAANGGGNTGSSSNSNTAFNFFNMRDLNREAYMQVSKEITSKTEDVVKNLANGTMSKEDIQFHFATSKEHSNLVFQTLWMSFLASFTTPFNENNDEYPVGLCLEGLQHGIRIASYFGVEMARTSFVGALIQFTNLSNVAELKHKNIMAIYKLLEVVLQIGDFLKDSWQDILYVVSQTERLQLIAKGIDRNSVPDVSSSRLKNINSRVSRDSSRSSEVMNFSNDAATDSSGFFGLWQTKKSNPIEKAQDKHNKQSLKSDISQLLVSSDISLYIDKIFTNSADLSAIAVIDFIKALTEVSIKEIESSQDSSQPRMFALQKMVDVCYYNMERIRVEWKPMWEVMGEAFISIASNKNKNLAVVFFAIDSLRQLSMRFLNLDELQGFEFQCDFLKPFKFIIQNSSSNYEIQEMCLECFNQFIIAKGELLKSGWKPIFESLQYLASSTIMENISTRVLNIANFILKSNVLLDKVFKQMNISATEKDDVFLKFLYVFRNICKNPKFPKNALKSLDSLKKIRKYIFKDVKVGKQHSAKLSEEQFNKLWYPLLFSYHDIIMSSKDMEVRSMALTELFECLVGYGSLFTVEIWTKICNLLLFPIFAVLSMHWNVDQFNSHDELNVWLSTTLIQALRNCIALFTHYFDMLETLLPGFLDLLVSCICQENDTIARIGRSCLQQLIIENSTKFSQEHWVLIIDHFEKLFELTTATELFESDPLKKGRRKSILGQKQPTIDNTVEEAKFEDVANDNKQSIDFSNNKNDGEESGEVGISESLQSAKSASSIVKSSGLKKQDMIRKRLSIKNTIVVKCVLQLMIIELLSELFDNEKFRNNKNLKITQLIRVTSMLERSYTFSRDFNDDIGLRTRLVEAQVVDKIPNLLKQESSSAAVLIAVLFKLYFQTEDDKDSNKELMAKLMEFCVDIIQRYISFDENKMEKNIITMRPVVIEILQGVYEFDDVDFKKNSSTLYHLVLQILDKNLSNAPLRSAVKQFFEKVGDLYF